MTLKTIITAILILIGFFGYAIGLEQMCTAITITALCGGATITLAGFTFVYIGGLMAIS